MKKKIVFLKHFLRNPESVGAITALNTNVANQLTKYLKARPKGESSRILEVGAGTGSVTRTIFSNLSPRDRLDIVEIDPVCCTFLEKEFCTNSRVQVICDSIVSWKPPYEYDFIISTLPFNSLNPDFVQEILLHYQNLSTSTCIFTYVEYIGLGKLSCFFSKKKKKMLIKRRAQTLKAYREKHLFDRNAIFASFPPCHVYHMKTR